MGVISILTIFILTILIWYIFGWLRKDRIQQAMDKLPGPIKIPILGTLYTALLMKEEDIFKKTRFHVWKYGPIFRTWLLSIPMVDVRSPEYLKVILSSSVQLTKGFFYDAIRPWLGDGLLISTGKKWYVHRKIITPTFHFQILENFLEVFVKKSELLVQQLQDKANSDIHDLQPFITRCTLDIISETAMGVEINAMLDPDNEYVKSVYGIRRSIVERLLKPWLYPDFIYNNTKDGQRYKYFLENVHSFTRNVIKDRKQRLLSKTEVEIEKKENEGFGIKSRKAFLDLLLETSIDGERLNDTEIREEVDTFMFAGHDTTTTGICWSLFLLGNYPEIQEQVYQEVKEMFAQCDGHLTINDLNELKLLERCIKETLRIYPSVPVITRKLTEDLTLGDYEIPAGCNVNLHISLVHRDPDIYPDPDKFDPDRFLPENIKNRDPYAYIPFSAGPRNCIGQRFAMYEEKTLIAYILNSYKITAVENQDTVAPLMELVLKSKNGLLVKLEPRKA